MTSSLAAALLEGLNEQQRMAVEAKDGPTLVIAGPGSGKTRVLTARVAYLVGVRDVFPFRIMAVTFTNKAAREMRERVTRLTGQARADDLMLGTFHSICARLLRRAAASGEVQGVDRNFTIYDADDQVSVVKAVLAEMNLDEKKYKPQSMHSAISTAKNELITPDEYKAETYFNQIAGRVYKRYNEILRTNNALDFDDLLMETVRMLEANPASRDRLQERYAHVLIDEFQDTNLAQYRLVRLLSGKHRNLYAVGDPDQSVYAWRGADYRNVLRLREDHPDLNVIPLAQNYRSTQTILNAAMAVIKRNPNRQHIELFTDRGAGPKIALRELLNEDEEGEYVTETVAELVRQKAATLSEIAVMYRTNAQSRALEDAFVRAKIDYKLVGATRFYARREIKDALAYLRILNNPADTVSLARIINTPARGIGEKSVQTLLDAARRGNMTPHEVLTRGELAGRAAKALKDFGALWTQWLALKDELSAARLLDHVITSSGYKDYIDDGSDDGADRWANVLELRNVAASAGDQPLSDFLNDIALVSETDNLDAPDAVTLLTLHAAKGLEYKVVFIVGLVEGVLPHQRSLDDAEQMGEERRLMYVGITRAKDRLYLLRPFRRSQWGMSDVAEPSRFLRDLPDDVIDGKVRKAVEATAASSVWKPQAAQRAPSNAAATQFKPGDRVQHATFGEGTVLGSTKLRDDEEVDVFFAAAGRRRLSVAMSGLRKAR